MHARFFYTERIGYALHVRFFYIERIGYALHITLFCSGRIKYALHISPFYSNRIKYASRIAPFCSGRIKYALHNSIFHIGRIINAVNFGFSIAFGMLTVAPFGGCHLSVCQKRCLLGAESFSECKERCLSGCAGRAKSEKRRALYLLSPIVISNRSLGTAPLPSTLVGAPTKFAWRLNKQTTQHPSNSTPQHSPPHPRRGAHQICLAPQQTNNSTPQQLNNSTLPALRLLPHHNSFTFGLKIYLHIKNEKH